MPPSNLTPADRPAPAWWLAGRFLLPWSHAAPTECHGWSSAARWFVFWGLLAGICYALFFGGIWKVAGEHHHIRFVPVAFVWMLDVALLGYRLLGGLAGSIERIRGRPAGGPAADVLPIMIGVLVVAILKLAMLLALPVGGRMPPESWRDHLGILYPRPAYRPLILMPLWGRWAMTLALTMGRIAPGGSPRLKRMAEGHHLVITVAQWLICAALTVIQCSAEFRHLPGAMMIALGVLVGAYWVSFALARRLGGQTEESVLATGLAAELIFLVLYLPLANLIYWY